MCQELFDDEEVRGGGKGRIEGKDGPGAAETIAGEMQFRHCVY